MTSKKSSEIIREALTAQGIPLKRQIKTIANILGIHYTTSHQKFTGLQSWTHEQLKKISQEFSIPLDALTEPDEVKEWNAILILESKVQRCKAQIEEKVVDSEDEAALVATKEKETWTITSYSEADSGKIKYKVNSIKIMPPPMIAALDDDPSIPKIIATQFAKKGMKVDVFFDEESLLNKIEKNSYEGYVLDWMIDKRKTAEKIISNIRKNDYVNPLIVILTGEISTEAVNESDLARMVEMYNVLVLEKPASIKLLSTIFYKKIFFKEML